MTPEQLVIENLFMIPNKDKEDVPFIANTTQNKFEEAMTGRDIVAKARQEGISSWVLAKFAVRCMSTRNTRAVVISHEAEATERLFRRVKYFLENLRGPKPVIDVSNRREITFSKTDSWFYIGTAGARSFGRGDTITDLHCSEVAFWDNAKELMTGLLQAVPRSGTIVLESTGNGREYFYRRVMAAANNKGRYKLHFFNWIDFPEYDLKIKDSDSIVQSLDEDLEEPYLYNVVGLTPGQLKFRREKLEELEYDLDLFKQEYPITLDECFRTTGRSIFNKVRYVQNRDWQRIDSRTWGMARHPDEDDSYVIGVDVGGGVGGDNSVIECVSLGRLEQVLEWADNKVSPDIFAHVLANIGKKFNNAYIVVEANNHGIATLSELSKIYPLHRIYKRLTKSTNETVQLTSLGLLQTARLKPYAVGALRKLLATTITIHSEVLKSELDTFIEDEAGKLRAEDGEHDDRVMAMAALAFAFQRTIMLAAPKEPEPVHYVDPFSVDAIINEMRGRNNRFPIDSHLGDSYAGIILN